MRRLLPAILGLLGLFAFFYFAYPFLAKAKGGSQGMSREKRQEMEAQLKRLDGARADWKAGKLSEAEAVFRDVRKTMHDDLTAYELGKILMDEGKLDEAKNLIGYVMHPNSRHGSTYATNSIKLKEYADLCKKVGDSAEAKWALAKANELIAANQRQRDGLEKQVQPTNP